MYLTTKNHFPLSRSLETDESYQNDDDNDDNDDDENSSDIEYGSRSVDKIISLDTLDDQRIISAVDAYPDKYVIFSDEDI